MDRIIRIIGILTLIVYLVIPIGGASFILPRLFGMVLDLYYNDLIGISLNALSVVAWGILLWSIFRADRIAAKILTPCCLLLLYFPIHRWITTFLVKNAPWMNEDLFIVVFGLFAALGLIWTALVWVRSNTVA